MILWTGLIAALKWLLPLVATKNWFFRLATLAGGAALLFALAVPILTQLTSWLALAMPDPEDPGLQPLWQVVGWSMNWFPWSDFWICILAILAIDALMLTIRLAQWGASVVHEVTK